MRTRVAVTVVMVWALTAGGLSLVSQSPAFAAKTTLVNVTLREFKIRPKPTSVKASATKFVVKNVGVIDHEMVVVRSDGQPLPLAADGSVDEDAIPVSATVGEVEDVAPGKSKKLTVKGLEPGTYALFCNVVDQSGSTTLAHYAQGMHTNFTVRDASPVAAKRTINGRVTYPGNALDGHKIIIAINRQGDAGPPAYSATLTKTGTYTISNVADGTYTVLAFIDLGDDMGAPQANEPVGTYDPDANGVADLVVLEGGVGVNGINVSIKDR